MLSSQSKQNRTFEEIMGEAFSQIPIYSKEWTNFNPSDPGVTILENLAAFSVLQQEAIDKAIENMHETLLNMIGFKKAPTRCSRVLLEARQIADRFDIPSGQRFQVGDVSFETNQMTHILDNRFLQIILKTGEQETVCPYVLDYQVPISTKLFGDDPKAGDSVTFLMKEIPDTEHEMILYVEAIHTVKRTAADEKTNWHFADVEWQYLGKEGYVPISCKDQTCGFLVSGEIKLKLKNAVFERTTINGMEGYAIRCVLKKARYDIVPEIKNIYGFLFEAWQKETRSICYTYPKMDEISVYCDILDEEYISVFCREQPGEPYRKYNPALSWEEKGRFYRKEKLASSHYKFSFHKEFFGYGPAKGEDSIRILAYNEEMMRQYDLGQVYGFDEQEIELPVKNIVPQSFSVVAKRINEQGEAVFDFVKPDRTKENELQYSLNEADGKMVIHDAGDFIEARLFLCGCCVTKGGTGNVLAENEFLPVNKEFPAVFVNPADGSGGCFQETLGQLKKRFVQEVNRPYAAVKNSDYEQLIREIPGICVHKVKAKADYEKNRVDIVVKPDTLEEFPKLSAHYKKILQEYMDSRRLLSTEIRIVQPEYIPINVQGMIYVRKNYERCREQIEEILREKLDYTHGNQKFGERLKFDDLFHSIEQLDCVEYIHSLSIYPQSTAFAAQKEMDVLPDFNGLCYPGDFYLELSTSIE